MLNNRIGLTLCASVAMAACGTNQPTAPQDNTPAITASDDAIIGGFASKNLDQVGTVGIIDDTGKYYTLCTATLLAPQVVLTAKHCAVVTPDPFTPPELWGKSLLDVYTVAFATGNSLDPTHVYQAVDSRIAPVQEGGFVGLGNDVAIFLLKDRINDIKPLAYTSTPTVAATNLLGKKAAAAGYGSQTNLQDQSGELEGTIKVGATTISNYSGKVYEFIFGSFAGFIKELVKYNGQDTMDQCLADATCAATVQGWYDGSELLAGYELWASRQAGDAITCHGDEGGPLLKKVSSGAAAESASNTTLQVLAVASGGLGSDSLACDYGTVYATFGDDTITMINDAITWVDPCELSPGLTATTIGQCDGTVATRCTTRDEGPRHLSQLDCAELNQTCGLIDGLTGCLDASGAAASKAPATAKVVAPAPRTLQGAVQRAATGKTGVAAKNLFAKFKK